MRTSASPCTLSRVAIASHQARHHPRSPYLHHHRKRRALPPTGPSYELYESSPPPALRGGQRETPHARQCAAVLHPAHHPHPSPSVVQSWGLHTAVVGSIGVLLMRSTEVRATAQGRREAQHAVCSTCVRGFPWLHPPFGDWLPIPPRAAQHIAAPLVAHQTCRLSV